MMLPDYCLTGHKATLQDRATRSADHVGLALQQSKFPRKPLMNQTNKTNGHALNLVDPEPDRLSCPMLHFKSQKHCRVTYLNKSHQFLSTTKLEACSACSCGSPPPGIEDTPRVIKLSPA